MVRRRKNIGKTLTKRKRAAKKAATIRKLTNAFIKTGLDPSFTAKEKRMAAALIRMTSQSIVTGLKKVKQKKKSGSGYKTTAGDIWVGGFFDLGTTPRKRKAVTKRKRKTTKRK
jgi:hypothetical protein